MYSLKQNNKQSWSLRRENAIQLCVEHIEKINNSCIVSTTGMISRELYSYRFNQRQLGKDLHSVGSMGHASQIALGIALAKRNRIVFCFDGDGAILMHQGALAIVGSLSPNNFYHIVFDNEAHDSVGGQPTVSLHVDLCAIALASGYVAAFKFSRTEEIEEFFSQKFLTGKGPVFVQIKVLKGSRIDLTRPILTPLENKKLFQSFIFSTWITVAILIFTCLPAYAYLEPGSTTLIFQLIICALSATFVILKTYGRKLTQSIKNKFKRNIKNPK